VFVPFRTNPALFAAAAVIILSLINVPGAAAQARQVPPTPAVDERLTATAIRVEDAPAIDGVLDDAAWQKAPVHTGFVQADPLEGAPATENTEVRLVYDDQALYVGVTLHDSDPSRIVTTDTRRDADLNQQDSFQMVFDTFHDLQNGFVFGTNPAGVTYDAQIRNLGGLTTSWDGTWDVRTAIGETSWTAEFRIPLRTLRYGPPPQRWGLNFRRTVPRHRETSYWAPLPRIYDLSRLSAAGELRSLQLPAPRNLKVMPYLVSSANRDYNRMPEPVVRGDWGLDAKIGITPGLNLDLTYNTDFAQVEVDTQQINLTRFNLRFPEKRAFFLENSGLFDVGFGNELDLFFTRRIGLDNAGNLVPIVGGGRLSGRVGNVNVGVLNLQTDSTSRLPGNNFTTARVNQELGNRSSVGAMFVNRKAMGDLAGTDDWNRTWGVDGSLGIGQRASITGFAARTETPGLDAAREWAYSTNINYQDTQHRALLEYGVTGEGFNPEVGFLQQSGGYRRFRAGIWETLRQEKIQGWGFRELQPHVWYRRYDRLDGGGLIAAEFHGDYYWDWQNGNFISTGLMGTWEGLDRPFEIYPGVIVPPGEHGGLRYSSEMYTDRRRWLFGRVEWNIGRFLTGRENSPTFQMTIRQGGRLTVDTTWAHRTIRLPQGSFRTNLGNTRVTYNFTPMIFVQSLLQYNDRTERWSTNLRLHWLQTGATGLYVVYNTTESMEGMGPVDRTFVVKYVRQFDLFN
jgi:hypothetical protein